MIPFMSTDEDTTKARGGIRRNAGRKTEDHAERVEKHTVTLYPMTARKLKVIGGGNMSRGIRIAANVAFDKYQDGNE